jgi:two-component system, sensor histidine kinase and response regulator
VFSQVISERRKSEMAPVQAEKKDLRILVVEDDLTNQKVALFILAALGYTADIAGGGSEALHAFEEKRYDIIFMDIQMPGMDGLETTARIRAIEKDTGNHTSIIAVTAHTMPGYREDCLAAGMDNYIEKPVNKQVLAEILSSFTSAATAMRSGQEREPPPSRQKGDDDFDILLNCLGGNRESQCEVLDLFLDDTPRQLDKLDLALRNRDFNSARHLGHTLKGASSNIGAFAMSSLSLELENAATAKEGVLLGELYPRLQKEYEVLKGSISDYQKALT